MDKPLQLKQESIHQPFTSFVPKKKTNNNITKPKYLNKIKKINKTFFLIFSFITSINIMAGVANFYNFFIK